MGRKQTSMNIESELIDEAKRCGLNMGELAEHALREKLRKPEEVVNPACWFCGREFQKQTRERLDYGLSWACPEEVWMCNICEKDRINRLIKTRSF